jgi:hypothetical protein
VDEPRRRAAVIGPADRQASDPQYSSEWLYQEANHLHRALFGGHAPDQVRRQYVEAIHGATVSDSLRLDLRQLIERGVDLEALELALRRVRPLNPLTQRFRVISYLAEVRPENYGRFVTERRRFFTGWWTLGIHLVRSFYKLAKGQRLLRIHDLC